MPPELPTGADGTGRTATGDEQWLDAWRDAVWRRWRVLVGLYGAVAGLGVALLVRAALEGRGSPASLIGVMSGVVVFAVIAAATRGVRDVRVVLDATERMHPDLGNALLAWHESGRDVAPAVAAHLAAQARAPLAGSPRPRPYGRRAWSLALAALALGAVTNVPWPLADSTPTRAPTGRGVSGERDPVTGGPLAWVVTVTPPAYAHAAPTRLSGPTRVEVLAGSRVEVRFTAWPAGASIHFGTAPVPLDHVDGGASIAVLTPASSDVVIVRDRAALLATIALVVRQDAVPRVRIVEPAADLRRAVATGEVPIRVAARDDLGLRDLRLRYTKVSGSGESFTFEDGEWPVQVARTSPTAWHGAYALDLSRLGLAPGDSVVYHAVAHDARPGAEGAAESERFLIEIPRAGEAAGGDFSLPQPEEKFALSQRMVIQLTERLLERRPRLTADDYRQQAQGLAIAQRRVRAEFVFMLGGEVEDEFEEAAHSHEVESGRLDNRGQGDLTDAVRQMAQAEARLTDADLREALPYEYRALAALQAAFGKARYFMRTLPVPVQVDSGRRLQGDRSTASSARWERAPLDDQRRAEAIDVLKRLEAIAPGDRTTAAALLPAIVGIDRGSAEWVALSQRVLDADGATAVTRALRARLLAGTPAWMAVPLPRGAVETRTPARGRRP